MRQIVTVFSGLPFSGKTWSLERMRNSWPHAKIVQLDDVFRELYPGRADAHVTKIEHVYKNEVAREHILRALVLGAGIVFTELVMLTRADHQQPFMSMIGRANTYVQAIEREYAQRERRDPRERSVIARVVLLHCSVHATKRRAERSERDGAQSDRLVTSLRGIKNAVLQFELPTLYEPLYVDTSDETPTADAERYTRIARFIQEGTITGWSETRRRAKEHLEDHRALVQTFD